MYDTMTVIPHNYTPCDATHGDINLDITPVSKTGLP